MADARTLVRPADVRAALPVLERARFADGQQQRFIDRLRETLNTRFGAGGPLAERAPTWGELADAGLVDLSAFGARPRVGLNGADGEPGQPGEAANADETPTAPTGFTGVGAATTAILKWDAPTTAGYAYTELWAAGVDNVAVAVRIQTPSARVAADRVGASGIDKWYWIRHISRGGKIGPFQAVSGLKVTTGSASGAQQSAAYDELIVARGLIVEALIGDEEVGNSKIRNLSVDDAKMLNVGVDKLLAGSLAVGRYIQSTNYAPNVSGWRISADGYAEFGNVKVRGDVQATSLNGQIIGNSHIQPGAVTYDKLSVGSLSAISANLGDVVAGRLSMQGAGQSYIRSNTKWYDDEGEDGWALGRDADGTSFVHVKTGGMGATRSIFRMHSNGQALLYFGNGAFSVDHTGALFCNSATISGNVTANNLVVNTVTAAHILGEQVSMLRTAGAPAIQLTPNWQQLCAVGFAAEQGGLLICGMSYSAAQGATQGTGEDGATTAIYRVQVRVDVDVPGGQQPLWGPIELGTEARGVFCLPLVVGSGTYRLMACHVNNNGLAIVNNAMAWYSTLSIIGSRR